MTVPRADLLQRLRASRAAFVSHADAPPADHDKRYGVGKWSVREILAHLADCEVAYAWRFLRAAAEPGSNIEVFDENAWAKELDYPSRPVAVSRGLFLGLRDALIGFVETLPEAKLLSCAVHPERGSLPAWQWASLTANHARHHLEQAACARSGRPWVSTGPVTV